MLRKGQKGIFEAGVDSGNSGNAVRFSRKGNSEADGPVNL